MTNSLKPARLLCTVAAGLLLSTSLTAQDHDDRVVGSWKLNVEKSEPAPGMPPISSETRVFEKTGPKTYRDVIDMVFQNGQKFHSETEHVIDGKERSGKGLPEGITEVCEQMDADSAKCTNRRSGQKLGEVVTRISPDAKTLTFTATFVGQDGKEHHATNVYTRQ